MEYHVSDLTMPDCITCRLVPEPNVFLWKNSFKRISETVNCFGIKPVKGKNDGVVTPIAAQRLKKIQVSMDPDM